VGVPFVRLLYKRKTTDVFLDVTHLLNFEASRGLEADGNTMELEFKNSWDQYVHTDGKWLFQDDDLFRLFLSWTPIDIATDTPIFFGSVQETDQDFSGIKRLNVSSQDRTALLLSRRFAFKFSRTGPAAPGGDGWSAPEIIKKVVREVSHTITSTNPSFPKIDVDTFVETERPTSVEVDKPFPSKDLALIWKSAYDWIKACSQVEFTNSEVELNTDPVVKKPYYFFIDKDNKLHWRNRENTVLSTAIFEGQEGVFSMKFNRSIYEIVNMIIFNAGTDKNGNGVLWYRYNEKSENPELRMRFIAMNDLAESYRDELIQQDGVQTLLNESLTATDTTITVDSTTSFTSTDGFLRLNQEIIKYATISGNDFQTCTRGMFGTSPTNHLDNSLVDKADTYGNLSNSTFRDDLKIRGKARAQSIMDGTESLRWKGRIRLRGRTDYEPGDLIPVTAASFGMSVQELRVEKVRQQITKGAWITTLNFEEDPEEIQSLNV